MSATSADRNNGNSLDAVMVAQTVPAAVKHSRRPGWLAGWLAALEQQKYSTCNTKHLTDQRHATSIHSLSMEEVIIADLSAKDMLGLNKAIDHVVVANMCTMLLTCLEKG